MNRSSFNLPCRPSVASTAALLSTDSSVVESVRWRSAIATARHLPLVFTRLLVQPPTDDASRHPFLLPTHHMSTDQQGMTQRVLTREEQDDLTPAAAVELLRAGNARFVCGDMTVRNHRTQIR